MNENDLEVNKRNFENCIEQLERSNRKLLLELDRCKIALQLKSDPNLWKITAFNIYNWLKIKHPDIAAQMSEEIDNLSIAIERGL